MAEQQTWQWPNRISVLPVESSNDFYPAIKRCMDILLAILLLILLLPLFLLIAISIKLDSPGPVFFSHERVGARRQWLGRQTIWVIQNFSFYKFRSMIRGADSSVH